MDIDRWRVESYLKYHRLSEASPGDGPLAKEADVWWNALNVDEQQVAWNLLAIERLLLLKMEDA